MQNTATQQDIRLLTLPALEDYFSNVGEKAYRARQVYQWLWNKSATAFAEMTNLSLPLRQKLEETFEVRPAVVHKTQTSADGTIKSAFKLHDGQIIEGVLIPADSRMTACISSQVGCALGCTFCATGYLGRIRNLDPGEIYDQVVAIARQAESHFGMPLTNIVFMGMGEPLLNYSHVLRAIELLTSEQGLGMSPRRITLSTAGIAKMIRKLADDGVRFNLALSLHAADDRKRDTIMPINESNSLDQLSDALRYFYSRTGNRITLEYVALRDFNDAPEDARSLVRFASQFPCKINIIEYNQIEQAEFRKSDPGKIQQFSEIVQRKGFIVNVRRSRGEDIDAACGQLANKEKIGE
jgi:23S rRNA (adenine2503-C2)-methyltransferase